MTIKFKYDDKINTVNIKIIGVLESSDIIDYFKQIIDGDLVKEGFIEIVDLNEAADFVLRYSDIDKIRELSIKLNKIGHKCSLMCAYNERSKGISSMMLPLYQKVEFEYFMCDSEIYLKNKLRMFQ